MSMGSGKTEASAFGEPPPHHRWEMDLVQICESKTSEDDDSRWGSTSWILVVVDLTTARILGVRLFAEEPMSYGIADAFKSIRSDWDDREPGDWTPFPLTLVLGSGLEDLDIRGNRYRMRLHSELWNALHSQGEEPEKPTPKRTRKRREPRTS